MGLDIYFHHVARQFEGDPTNSEDFNAFTEQVDKDAQAGLQKVIDEYLPKFQKIWDDAHYEEDGEQKENLWRMHDYNRQYFDFVVNILKPVIATNYDFKIDQYTAGVMPFPELKEALAKEVGMHYQQYDAYFRKVNFLFKYFEDRGKMVDQYYAFVEPEDVEDIIDKCEDILKDHSLAHELLPTQKGFFFGSTDYDEWYFHDVKDCLKQMKQYLKLFKGEGTGYVIFSW